MSPDLSIIIPTYRRPTSLPEALRSVLDQRGVEMEVIVIDDCAEGSAESSVLAVADPRVRYLRNPQPSKGRPAKVRNLGWPLATGQIVHFMDDDDLLPEGLYAAALATFKRYPDLGLVFGNIEPFGEPSVALDSDRALFIRAAQRAARLQRLGFPRAFAAHLLFNELLFVGGSSLIRRQCIEAVGGYNPELEIMEDVDFLGRIARRFGARYLHRASLYYRVWPSLMHRRIDLQELMNRTYERIHSNYRRDFGSLDFYALKIVARTILQYV